MPSGGFLLFGVNMLRRDSLYPRDAGGRRRVRARPGGCHSGILQSRAANPATVSGLNSSNKFQNIINSCTISIYQTGTNTLVPGNQIFSNATGNGAWQSRLQQITRHPDTGKMAVLLSRLRRRLMCTEAAALLPIPIRPRCRCVSIAMRPQFTTIGGSHGRRIMTSF